MEYLTLYSTARTGAVRVWEVAVDGDRVITRFGQLDGKMQEVVGYGTAKNVGRSNEISAAEDAENMAKRLTKQKMRKGYRKTLPEVEDFDPWAHAELPDNLSFYKPQNTMNATMTEMAEARLAWALKKYDGEAQVLVKWPDSSVDVFSRRMHKCHHQEPDIPWRERFSQQAEEVRNNPDIPPCSILLCEATAGPNKRDRGYVAQILKAKTPKAIKLQEEKGLLHFVVWDVAWWDGEQVLGEMEVRHRLDLALECAGGLIHAPHILVENEYDGIDHLNQIAREEGWEGWVIVDPTATYGERGFNLRGKPDRPLRSCKLKPTFEDDFIAIWDPDKGIGTYGSGKYWGRLGAVALYQFNAEGALIYICNCGNGFTKQFIEANSDPDAWPKVLQIEYDSRTYISKGGRTNALLLPRYSAVREDKGEDECINLEL